MIGVVIVIVIEYEKFHPLRSRDTWMHIMSECFSISLDSRYHIYYMQHIGWYSYVISDIHVVSVTVFVISDKGTESFFLFHGNSNEKGQKIISF